MSRHCHTSDHLFRDHVVSGDDWTFNGASTRATTHCYHDYPARMIPQIADKLLQMYGSGAGYLFDPYCGTGTSLVEGIIRGISVIGTDLNPLARLIAYAKLSTPNVSDLSRCMTAFKKYSGNYAASKQYNDLEIVRFKNIDFWFKPEVTHKLQYIKQFIADITNLDIKAFFSVAFSETVRESSNTRNGEFKLYRYPDHELEKFSPDVFAIMLCKLARNYRGNIEYRNILDKHNDTPFFKICGFNTVYGIPIDTISPNSIDIVITSPPYGDSRTTVAYGQYSRLSAEWLGMHEPARVDNKLMGGKVAEKVVKFDCIELDCAISIIRDHDEKRANEVVSFYTDLLSSITNVSTVIKQGGYACYVVGNRKVKGVVLPTDRAILSFFARYGFIHISTYNRAIPNKRMPMRNSPTNIPGVLDNTMTHEYVVVMQKTHAS